MFKNAIPFSCLLSVGILSVCLTDVAQAQFLKRQTIQNNTRDKVNDLQIVFTKPTTQVSLEPTAIPPGKKAAGVKIGKPTNYEWAQGTFGNINAGGMAYLDYSSACARCSFQKGQWTLNGNNVGDGVTKIGDPGILKANSPLSLTYFNNETFSALLT
jgi:hypothetical protein